MTDTMHLGLPFIEGSQAQKHVTHNDALRLLDAVIQIAVEDMTRTTPPASPAEGQRHVVASGPSGAWAGRADAIATWQDSAWVFLVPKTGWRLWSVAEASIFIFDGSAWQRFAPLANDVGQLGINTTASAPNLLSVKSNAALLAAITTVDGGSGDARLQIAKQASGNTASVFFSDNYSGRAEFGLTGDDHFRLKVSPDGASWQDSFVIDKTTANVSFNGFTDPAGTRRQLGAFGIVRVQKFTSSGTYTPDPKMTCAMIEMVGGGGGGGGVLGTSGQVYQGGGGGAGEYARAYVTAAQVGASKAVTIGSGGGGGSAGANNGSQGGTTSVGGLCSAVGGAGGKYGSGSQVGVGGAGGTGGSGDIATPGAPGGSGLYNAVSATIAFSSGNGGSSLFGGGALGVAGSGSVAGVAASGYGGGGSGGSNNGATGTLTAAGGNGASGFVIITEFCSG